MIFCTIREEPRRVLDYYVVDDGTDPYDTFTWLCQEADMEPCRYIKASAEAILATITEPPHGMDSDLAVDALNAELYRAAQDGSQRTQFRFIRKRSCVSGETRH
ncbi:MAG: hypothetical protein Devi2KO_00860 [Devosia indica]